jgi:hypothetical protein
MVHVTASEVGALALKLEGWIAMHADLRWSRRCRVVADTLARGLKDYCAPS